MDLWLTATLGVIQIVITALGVWVSLRPPKNHMLWIAAFIIVGLIGVGLTVELTSLADKSQEDIKAQLTQSQLELARINGETRATREIMESFSKSGIPGLKEFADAALTILKTNSPSQGQTVAATPPNRQLCGRASALATNLRAFEDVFQANEQKRRSGSFEPGKPIDPQTFAQQNQQDEQRSEQHISEFREQYFQDAKYLRDLIVPKLTPDQQKALKINNRQADLNLTTSLLAGGGYAYKIADYLTELAKTLCSPDKGY